MLLYLFRFAKVRAVRMANRETSYIKYVESTVDADKIYM
jgi:hypothetical protein